MNTNETVAQGSGNSIVVRGQKKRKKKKFLVVTVTFTVWLSLGE